MARPSELSRPWRGVSPEQRIAERRQRLIDAALEVFTARSFQASKVRDVCREAGLTERYFYESFSDKEALLGALSDTIVTDFVSAALPSIALLTTDFELGIEGAMRAVVSSLTDDPRRARILFVEGVGVSPAAEAKRRAVIGSLVTVLRSAAAQAFGEWVHESVDTELIARALIGAAAELLVAYVRNELSLDQDELVLNLTRLFLRVRPILAALAAEANDEAPLSTTQEMTR